MDPLAAKFADISPYNYVLGNPIIFIDPDGRAPVNGDDPPVKCGDTVCGDDGNEITVNAGEATVTSTALPSGYSDWVEGYDGQKYLQLDFKNGQVLSPINALQHYGLALLYGGLRNIDIGGSNYAVGNDGYVINEPPEQVMTFPIGGISSGGRVTVNGLFGGKKIPKKKIIGKPKTRGNAPIGEDGHPIELHHRNQTSTGPIDEMTRTNHRGAGNYKKNHSNTGQSPSAIDRKKFNTLKKRYWKKQWDNGRFDGL